MSIGTMLNKKVRNVFLMVFSQLLLTLFVGYWLITQYESEKKDLQEKLFRLNYELAREMVNRQVYDCVLYPIIQNMDSACIDSIKFKHIELRPEIKNSFIEETITFFANNIDIIPIIDKFLHSEYPPSEKLDENTSNLFSELMNICHRYGIRVNHSEYQNSRSSNSIPFDKIYFGDLLKSRLKYQGINIELTWVGIDEHIPIDENMVFMDRYNYDKNKHEMAIIFSQYESYLLSKILPQIIFAFILVSITAFSLIFTYRGFVKQVRLNMLRSDFINNITHELKIPVATAKAALEALRSFGLKADENITEEYLEMVSKEMNRLDSLTTRVLEHAKMEGQKHSMNLEETDLTAFSEHIVKSMKVLLKSQGVNINFASPDIPIKVSIDNVYVEGVIKNLIDNSVKYGGSNVAIQIVLWQDERYAYVSVSDNGPGIPKEYVNKVFDKFFRVPKGDKHNVKGYGLGLSFVDLVMKYHKGSIKGENLKEGGCRFTLRFPLDQNNI